MPWRDLLHRLAVLVLMLPLTAVLVAGAALGAEGSGSAWDEQGPPGHSRLVDRLAEHSNVRVIESTLQVLSLDEPSHQGLLFLFPTHRPASSSEITHVQEYVARGGTLVMAGDGHNALSWAHAFGIRLHGIPALLPPDQSGTCLDVTVSNGARSFSLCLPSPSTFANVTFDANDAESALKISNSNRQVFLDIDQDGNLSLGDQGPVEAPMVIQVQYGSGTVIAIADADLWRNEVLDLDDRNLDYAEALAEQSMGTIFVDSSGAQPEWYERMSNDAHRALLSPGVFGSFMWLCAVVALALAGLLIHPAPVLRPHDPPKNALDATHWEALQTLEAFMQGRIEHKTDQTSNSEGT